MRRLGTILYSLAAGFWHLASVTSFSSIAGLTWSACYSGPRLSPCSGSRVPPWSRAVPLRRGFSYVQVRVCLDGVHKTTGGAARGMLPLWTPTATST